MKSILITGVCGQIGTELIRKLCKELPTAKILATDIKNPPESVHSFADFHLLDVCNSAALAEFIRKHEVDTVYHLAALLSATGERNPALAFQVNLSAFFDLLEVSRNNGVKLVVMPSSIGAFGPTTPRDMTPNLTIMRPTTMYGITKVTGELLMEYYSAKFGLDCRGMRFPGIISSETEPGGGTTDYAVDFYYKAVEGKSANCFVKEETVLPFMYMPDAIDVLWELAIADASKLTTRTYNVTAFSASAKEFEQAIAEKILNFKVTYEPDYRQAIADSWPKSLDDSQARADWGWNPKFDLSKMTVDMIQNLRLRLKH
ncbi:MAG: NAD-dependent epimerase/dehydratase family protein [bacterium]|nr:NAD-dependent epimerase/dehydratase family protein [bacterium]